MGKAMTRGENANILVVDDNEDSRILIGLAARSVGATTDFADNGRQAMKMLGQNQYHILVLDLAMPELSGSEMLSLLKFTSYAEALSIVIVTAYPHLLPADDTHVDFKFHKPIDVLEFRKLLTCIQDGQPWVGDDEW